jgi:cephalosporin hydroxylase
MTSRADATGYDPTTEGPKELTARFLRRKIEMRMGEPLRDYWAERFEQHKSDTYADVPLAKLPEDLRVYERLLWADEANVVIELGACGGGSAL